MVEQEFIARIVADLELAGQRKGWNMVRVLTNGEEPVAQMDSAHPTSLATSHTSQGPSRSTSVCSASKVRPLTPWRPFFDGERLTLYSGDALEVMSSLAPSSVDCIVTSPPYYGQRDYGVAGQIGLEAHPREYLDRLVETFEQAYYLLKPSGSLWVVIGDTYWSGKGRPTAQDVKRRSGRFDRPQDRAGQGPLCVRKQQLLIPHRFAIAMQDSGWIVRNDNIWAKKRPMPDPSHDRSSLCHEFVFHFVKQQRYYYNMEAVSVPSGGKGRRKPPSTIWEIAPANSQKRHSAVFPEELVFHPIASTCPPGGILLDPFCGSGTTLAAALRHNASVRAVGIDISLCALEEAIEVATDSVHAGASPTAP